MWTPERINTSWTRPVWLAAVAFAALLAGACSSDTEPEITVGSIQVTVTTSGSDLDPDGYTVLLNGAGGESVGVNGGVVFSEVEQGDQEVSIDGLAANCSVSGTNPRTVTVVAEETAQVSFDVTCVALVGDLTITTTTTGDDIDGDGFTYSIDGGTAQAIGVNDATTIEVASGSRSVQLADVAVNCTVTGDNPRSVNVPTGGAASVDFVVSCTSTAGTLVVTTSTSGTDPDDGYTVSVDGGPAQAIGPNAVLTLNDTPAGGRLVELGGVANNCTVSGENPRTVTVPQNDAVQTDFTISCVPIVGDVEVVTSTTGSDLDPDDYSLVVDGKAPVPIGVVDTVLVADVPFGDQQVELQDLAPNCSVVNGTNPRTVTVPAEGMVSTTFVIDCVALEGTVSVTASTTGSDLDLDGYMVSVDGGAGQPVPTNGTIFINNVPSGDRSLQLSGVAPNCTVTSTNPDTVTVLTGDTVSHTFDVSCTAVTGSVDITTSTTGSSLDSDGYTVTVEGQSPQAIGINQMITVTDVAAGNRTVELTGVAANCTVAPNNPRTVTVPDGSAVATTFDVSCEVALSDQIVFDSDRDGGDEDIYVMNPNGTGVQRLTTHMANDSEANVSGTGTRIAFVSDRDGNDDIFVMDADGTDQLNLTSDPLTRDREPAFSPDGTKIAFTSDRDGDDDIYVMDADGMNVVQLTNEAGRDGLPAWSPDGTKIVFRSDRDSDTEIYVMDADGMNQTNLTNTAESDFAPEWSPDGTKIAFTSWRDGDREIFVMDADGMNQTQLTFNTDQDLAPTWSSDGSQIAFASDRDNSSGIWEIYVMGANGSAQTNVTNDVASDFEPSWSRIP